MSDERSTASGSGIGLGGATFLVFLVLKLTGTINWSWWWITAPLWGPLALFVAGALIVLAVLGIIKLLRPSKRRHLRQRGQAQMARQQGLVAETEARLKAADERRQDQ